MPKYVWNGPEDEVFEWKGKTYASGEPVPMTVEDYVAEVRSGHPLEPYTAENSDEPKIKSPDPDELVEQKEREDEEARRLAESQDEEPDESDSLGLGPRQRANLAAYGLESDEDIRAASDDDLRAAGLGVRAIAGVRSHA